MLVESRSLGGVLRAMTSEYLCSIAATNGQVGGFLQTEVAPILQLQCNDRVVLYLGDFDLEGHQIEANTRRVLEYKARRRIDWNRIAITKEQIAQRGLTPILRKDHRFTTEPGGVREFEAWECEARGQGTIQRSSGCLGRPGARTAQRRSGA
jgi:hypothetical protein